MKRQYSTALLLVGLVMLVAAPAWARRPNVILIMADDLGHECLRSYGGTSYDSRLLDEVAARGMRFTQCYSQPVCTPSRNQIMTGRSNARNYRAFGMLLPTEITFGNVMKDAGYKTCIAGKWQLSGDGPGTPTYKKGATPAACGFEQSCMWAYKHDLPPGVAHSGGWEGKRGIKTSRYWHPSIVENGTYRPTTEDDYGPDIYTQFIVNFIEKNQQDEFFVYYPMALTHAPFYPTPHSADLATADKFKNDPRYFGDMIAYTGHCVTRILDQLDKLGLAENTLVLFTTDNGSNRGVVSQQGARVVPGGKGLPIDAGCHAPLLAVWKDTIQPGAVCHDLVEFSDFLPTIAQVCDATLPTDRPLDGQSFLSQLKGQRGNPRAAIFMHYDKDPDARRPSVKRIRFAFDGRHKLYLDGQMFDVANDIDEERPLDTKALSADAQTARERLQKGLDAMPPWEPDNSVFGNGPDNGTKSRLQELKDLRAKASRQATVD
ncbi:MAG: sulfatase-like hydrolase/transferase [Pirellulales bacterium]